MEFQLEKYTGLWYLQYHIPQWFDAPNSENTTAEYALQKDGTVKVINTTYPSENGAYKVEGVARVVGTGLLKVTFSGFPQQETEDFNYVVQYLQVDNATGMYEIAIVTDKRKNALWVLTRAKYITPEDEHEILDFVKTLVPLKDVVRVTHSGL